jgi:phage tail P2-like protein
MSSVLPPNSTPLEIALGAISERLEAIPTPLPTLWDADSCPLEQMPWMAWALSLDDWQPDWSEALKRSRLRSAIAIQRRKGTATSVRMVVESFGGTVAIREWWQQEPRGAPHTFALTLTLTGADGNTASAKFVEQVITEVERTKPVRSHFTFTQGLQAEGHVAVIAAARAVTYRRLGFDAN